MAKFKTALMQTKVVKNKKTNVDHALSLIEEVAEKGADLAVLPEMFCCPYDNSFFKEYGEEEGGLPSPESARLQKRPVYM